MANEKWKMEKKTTSVPLQEWRNVKPFVLTPQVWPTHNPVNPVNPVKYPPCRGLLTVGEEARARSDFRGAFAILQSRHRRFENQNFGVFEVAVQGAEQLYIASYLLTPSLLFDARGSAPPP